jgi:hypothetical protein
LVCGVLSVNNKTRQPPAGVLSLPHYRTRSATSSRAASNIVELLPSTRFEVLRTFKSISPSSGDFLIMLERRILKIKTEVGDLIVKKASKTPLIPDKSFVFL